MRILIADDDPVSRMVLARTLAGWGHVVATAADGDQAWAALRADGPDLAVLDWMMPGLEGTEVCRRVRELGRAVPPYVILLTARFRPADIVAGLESGADDYLTKPFDRDELRARVRVGERVVGLQQGLAARVAELEAALSQVKQLAELLPICSYCRKIRDDGNYWQTVEAYVVAHTSTKFSHGICPSCWETRVVPELEADGRSS